MSQIKHYFSVIGLFIVTVCVMANPVTTNLPQLVPHAPRLAAKGYVLMDALTGKVLAEKNPHKRLAPASLTKMMTLYLVSQNIHNGQIKLTDKAPISKKAWRMGGSKMFVRAGQHVSVAKLMTGVIVDSGNDACVALSEYVAGSESAFTDLMNQQAELLGMKNTHYTDSTGLPHPDHYSTPYDLALLARALVTNFPKLYHRFYHTKWFTFNGIRQPNYNRLLWRGDIYDGIKTGHTNAAGYCLVSSGIKDGTRLISVVMGAPTDMARTDESQRLLTYGFRFFATHKLFTAHAKLATQRVWMGKSKQVNVGLAKDLLITIPKGQYAKLKATMNLPSAIKAPISTGQTLGELQIKLGDKILIKRPLVALNDDAKGGAWTRISDSIGMGWHKLWHH